MKSATVVEPAKSKIVQYRKMAGALIFLGGTQVVLGIVLAEIYHPGYSVSGNTISTLGIGPAAIIFNTSAFVLGVMIIIAAYLVQRAFMKLLISALLFLTGAGAIGVGLFPSTAGLIHDLAALVVFLFGGLSAIAAYRLEKLPLAYFSVLMGVIALIALILYSTENYLGLGRGGMERMIAYPVLLWAIGFGGYLMGSSQEA